MAQWHVAAAQQSGIKVMLDGQGADEQMAGYHAGFVQYVKHLIRVGRWMEIARVFIERGVVSLKTQFDLHFIHRVPASIRPLFEGISGRILRSTMRIAGSTANSLCLSGTDVAVLPTAFSAGGSL